MIDPSDVELLAMTKAGRLAGEFVESVKKTDLNLFSEDEWNGLIQAVCCGYVMSLVELRMSADDAMCKVENPIPAPGLAL